MKIPKYDTNQQVNKKEKLEYVSSHKQIILKI